MHNCDAYQGREAPIVILSLVRSNATNNIGFAASQNRINVSLSRAQRLLFVTGNIGMFQNVNYQHWKTICKILRNDKLVFKWD